MSRVDPRRAALRDGYTAYDYLPSKTYRPYELATQIDRVPEASVTWSDRVETAARELRAQHPVISVHDHLSVRPVDTTHLLDYRRAGREATPYEGLTTADVDVFIDGGPAAVSMIRSRTSWDWNDTLSDLGIRQADWAHQDMVSLVRTTADIAQARASGQVGTVLSLESCSPVGNDLDRLDVLFGFGVRLLGLVYAESNLVGGGGSEAADTGLTRFGGQLVHRLNDLGVIVDVSHASDATCLDAVRTSRAPVVITHAGARALWPSPRMKPDDVIRACAESGGYIGIEAAPHTTITRGHPRHDLQAVMEHVEYCIELVGIDHVAFGPDSHFGDHVAWHRAYGTLMGKGSRTERPALPPHESVEFVSGCENPAEATGNMLRWLLDRGYTAEETAKVAGGNALRVMREVWPR